MNLIKGDLLVLADTGSFDVIVQGCNCFNTMGSGLARQIREKWPTVYEADCRTVKGDYNKLGNYTRASPFPGLVVINAYTQYAFNSPGENKDVFEYIAFELILNKLYWDFSPARFGFPMIGMGLAGGNSEIILALLSRFSQKVESDGGSVTLVDFSR